MILSWEKWWPVLKRNIPVSLLSLAIGATVSYFIINGLVLTAKDAKIDLLEIKIKEKQNCPDDISSLQKELESIKRQNSYLSIAIKEKDVEIDNLLSKQDSQLPSSVLEKLNNQKDNLQSTIDSLKSDNKQLEAQIKSLRSQKIDIEVSEKYTINKGAAWMSSDGVATLGLSRVYMLSDEYRAVVTRLGNNEIVSIGHRFLFLGEKYNYTIAVINIKQFPNEIQIGVTRVLKTKSTNN